MSRERARRRAERLAVLDRERAARARRASRRVRRRELARRLTPRRGRTGRLARRSRGQRAGIVVLPLLAAGAVWLLVPDPALRVALTAVIVLGLPAVVVLVLGRRS